jgi:hypothetical protein
MGLKGLIIQGLDLRRCRDGAPDAGRKFDIGISGARILRVLGEAFQGL